MKQNGGSQAGSDYPVGRMAGRMDGLIRWLDGGYLHIPLESCRSASAPLAVIRANGHIRVMGWSEAGNLAGAAVMIAALLLFPRFFSFRNRAIAGAILFPLGWLGVFGGLALGDQPFMQSETVAFTWVGVSVLAIVLGITFLVPVFFEWRRKRRQPARRKERWRSGHWRS